MSCPQAPPGHTWSHAHGWSTHADTAHSPFHISPQAWGPPPGGLSPDHRTLCRPKCSSLLILAPVPDADLGPQMRNSKGRGIRGLHLRPDDSKEEAGKQRSLAKAPVGTGVSPVQCWVGGGLRDFPSYPSPKSTGVAASIASSPQDLLLTWGHLLTSRVLLEAASRRPTAGHQINCSQTRPFSDQPPEALAPR